jgi:hypothetical protein
MAPAAKIVYGAVCLVRLPFSVRLSNVTYVVLVMSGKNGNIEALRDKLPLFISLRWKPDRQDPSRNYIMVKSRQARATPSTFTCATLLGQPPVTQCRMDRLTFVNLQFRVHKLLG